METSKFTPNAVGAESVKVQTPDLTPITTPSNSNIILSRLPSKGLTYGTDYTVSYIPYTYGVIKHIASSNYFTKDGEVDPKALAELIRLSLSYVEVRGFDKSQLTFLDYEFMELHRKFQSKSDESEFKLNWICNQCQTENISTFRIPDIKFPELKIEKLPITLTLSNGDELVFSLLTIARVLEFYDNFDKLKQYDDTLLDQAKFINNGKTIEENVNYISNLSDPEDIKLLNYVVELLDYSYKDLEVKCKKCGKTSKIPFQSISEYIIQEEIDSESIKSRVKFG